MASSSTSTMVGNMVVVTHVLPVVASGEQPLLLEGGQRFKRGEPKALGTVQIMIGLTVLMFSIALVASPTTPVYSGISVWGPLIYIASGSVTVSADKRLSRCLMNASLVMNIIAAILSGINIIADVVISCTMRMELHGYLGFSILLTVFHLLQFFVSITVAAYTSYAICSCYRKQPQNTVQTADGMFAAQAPPHFQAMPLAHAQPHPQVEPYYKNPDLGSTEPPAYEPGP